MSRKSSARFGSNDGSTSVLARTSSFSGVTEDVIKSTTQRFDLEIVFKLNLSGRGLSRMLGPWERCVNLTELNLSGNQIARIEGLECCPQLRRLVLTSNRVARVEGLAACTALEHLALQDNKLPTLESLALPELAALPHLRTLLLQNVDRSLPNPVCRTVAGYKAAVLAALPNLANLDGERSPSSCTYAELAAEWEASRAAPPPSREWALPEPAPWLQGVDNPEELLASVSRPGGPDVELRNKHGTVSKQLDECEMLAHVLRQEAGALRAQLEAKGAGGG